MSLPRYPEYKDSGVAWLGEVPGNWDVKPVKAVATCNDDVLGESTAADYEIEYVEISGVDAGRGITSTDVIPFGDAPSRARRRVQDGDVLVSTVRTYLRAIAPVNNPPGNMIASTGFAVIRPRIIAPHFLGYLFQAEFVISEVIARSVGVSYPAINASDLMRVNVPIPLVEEQQTIAAFLDRETGKIDALIAEQQRLVELLAEKRQAVISHAVTKGLNPGAPMKDSGVEWLGEVPIEWTVKRIKYLAADNDGIQMGPFGGMLLDLDSEETGFKVYGQENTISGDFNRGHRWISKDRFTALSNYHVGVGDLLLTRKGSLGNARLVQTLPQPGIVDSDTIRVRVNDALITHSFLAFLLHEARYVSEQITLSKRGAILPGLNSETIANISIILPPLNQQQKLMEFLVEQTAKFDTLAAEANRAVSLLQERRSALISAAVTGKMDVRGLAPA